MTTVSEEASADLKRRIAELERRLETALVERDAAIDRQTASTLVNFRLQNELRAAHERQNASAEILRTIASAPGDAPRSLQQIAETCARLFGAPSVSIQLAENGKWTQAYRFGDSATRVRAAVPLDTIRVGGPNLPGMVIADNRQIHLPDLDHLDPAFAHWPGPPHMRAAGTRTVCGTPLRREDKAIGVLIIYRDQLAPFTTDELALLQSFADQAAIAIENARLFNETREGLERQTATAEILKVIASSPSDVQPVFEAIAEKSNRLVDGFSTAVYGLVEDVVHLRALTSTSPAGDAALRALFPAPFSSFVFNESFREGKIVRIADTEDESVTPSSLRDVARLRGWRSWLAVPLLREGMLIGIITVTRAGPGLFADHHVQLLQTFADQAVIAIENARLFNETREALERQTATADILKVIASSPSDVQPVFEAIATRAKSLVGGFSSTVFRFIDGMAHLEAFTPTTPQADEFLRSTFPRPVAEFTPFRLTQAGEIMQIPDTEALTDDIKDIARARGFRSMVFAPLMNMGASIGFIAVTRVQPGSFSEHHVQLLQTFADQAVIAIENARLFDEVQARTRELSESLQFQTATSEVLKVISRSPSNLQPVMDTIVQTAQHLCQSEYALIMHGDDEGLYRIVAHANASQELLDWLQDNPACEGDGSAVGICLSERQTIHLHDSLADSRFTDLRRQGVSKARTMLAVPLVREAVVVGVIFLARTRVEPFTEKQVNLVTNFADQAVIAIGNVRLFEEVQARTRELSESLQQQTATADVLKVISRSTFDLQPVLDVLVSTAAHLCDAGIALIFRPDGEMFRSVATFGLTPEYEEFVRTHAFPLNRGSVFGRVVLDREVVQVGDLAADPDYTLSQTVTLGKARTALGVPLLREGKPIGVFSLARYEVRPFTPKQIELVATFADQAVIAIENARLLNELRDRTKELSRSLDDLRTAQDRLIQTEKLASLGQLTAGIAHEIKNPLNFVNNFAALSAELTDELKESLKPAVLDETIRAEVDELTGLLKDNLGKVVQHGKRADSIVKNMLLHSREGSGEHRPADVNALVDESLNLAYHGARAEKPHFNVTLQRNFDAEAGMIEVFPQEITRVFLNLISNGFYAVAKRKAELGDGSFEPTLSATTKGRADHVEIRIRDNGTGIPPDVKEKMFNPFFTTKPAGEGTGLGLSMSHDIIVKQHGGAIEVDTLPGEFTEFIIVLPRTSNHSNMTRG